MRKLVTRGSLVELHSLVAAFKLNGQSGECLEYDSDMQRYNILLKSGETKKVKPQNVKWVAQYRKELVNLLQIRVLKNERKKVRSEKIQILKKWECVIPNVVSARVLSDWAKLDTLALKHRLLESKRVNIATLSDNVKIVFISLPRTRLATPEIAEEDIKLVETVAKQTAQFFEKEWFKEQVYFMLPFGLVDSVELPVIKRGLECSFPLYMYLADALLLCLKKGDDLDSLQFTAQRLDVACAKIACTDLMLFAQDSRDSRRSKVKLSLPSRGKCDENEINVIKDIEAGLAIVKPKPDDLDAFIQFKHSF